MNNLLTWLATASKYTIFILSIIMKDRKFKKTSFELWFEKISQPFDDSNLPVRLNQTRLAKDPEN